MASAANFAIVIGDSVTDGKPTSEAGRIEASGEEDIYTFTNAPGQRVFFDSFGRNGTIYWQVFDASGKELFNWDFNWGDPGHFTLPVGGTNTVRAFGIGGATGIYGFRVWGVPMAQNYSISIDQTVSDGIPAQGAGRIDAPGAVDFYTFTNAPGQTVFLHSLGRSGVSIYWQLVDATGRELLPANTDIYYDAGRFTLTVAGTNQVRVYTLGESVGTYGFRISTVPSPSEYSIVLDEPVVLDAPEFGAGIIETPGEVDFYTFTNAPGQSVFFDAFERPLGVYWQVTDSQGRELFNSPISGIDPGQFTLPMAGTNRVRVYALDATVATYGFTIWAVPQAQFFTIATDQPVALDVPEAGAGYLETPGAVDLYTFTNASGQVVFFDVLNGPTYIRWQALDAAGREIFDRDFSEGDRGSFTLPIAGTNRVRVYASSGVPDTTGGYSFRVRSVPAPQNFVIAVDQPVRADVPALGAGKIETAGAVDLYSFINAPGQVVYFDVLSGPSYIRWQVLDAAGNELFDRDFSEYDAGVFALPMAGTNRIRAYTRDQTTGTYSFRVRPVPGMQSFTIAIDQAVSADIPFAGTGRIEAPGAVDFYTFTNAPGQTIFFDSFGTTGGVYWQMQDANGRELFNLNFNSGDPGIWHFPQAGTNRIRVYGGGEATGTYGFQLANTAANGAITNLSPRADRFVTSIGATVTNGLPAPGAGNLEAPGAKDIYTFTAIAGTQVYFEDLGASTCCLDWYVYDESGNTVLGDRLDGGDPGRYKLNRSGVYTIVVQPAGAVPEWVGPYSFRLREMPLDQTFSIAIGATVTNGLPAPGAGNLEAPGAKDIYTFTATAGTQVYFEDLGSKAYYLVWSVQDPADNYVFLNDIMDGSDPGIRTLNLTGTYTITTQPYSADPNYIGDYSFRLRPVSSDETFSLQIGTQITNGIPATGAGKIEMFGARDRFTFTNAPGQTVYFDSFGSVPAYALYWRAFDATGNQLFDTRFNDADPGLRTLGRAGTNTIVVYGSTEATGSYAFKVWDAAPQRFNFAINDTIADGVPAVGAGRIETPGRYDYFRFTNTPSQTVFFDSFGSIPAYTLRWQAFDAAGTLLFDNWLNDGDPGARILERAGTNTIVVYGSGDATGTYGFNVWGARPFITQQPLTARSVPGGSHTFSARAASPFGPLTYQWRLNGANIGGANTALLILSNITPAIAGNYDIVVSNPNGSITSQVAVLTLDAGGLFVAGFGPGGLINSNVTQLRVAFNESVQATSFTASDIVVRGPSGVLNNATFNVTQVDSRTFNVNIPALAIDGLYTVEIGPDIRNLSGQPMTGGVFLPVYATDFETGTGDEWSRSDTLNSAVTTSFLGRFGNENVTLTLSNLPPHNHLRLLWDLDVIDSWDGDNSPDYFGFNISGLPQPAWENTFHNWQGTTAPQSFPGVPTIGITNFFGNSYEDSIYQDLQFDFSHNTETLIIGFYGRNLQDINDESWGLDNVRVQAATPTNGLFTTRFTIDRTPPTIVSGSPSGLAPPPVSAMEITFSESVQPATFDTNDIQMLGPSGWIAVNQPQRIGLTRYRLTFPEQRADGEYRLVIGPNIMDWAGNAMLAPATNSFTIGHPPVSFAIEGPRLLSEAACTNGQWFGTWAVAVAGVVPTSFQYAWSFGDQTPTNYSAVTSVVEHRYLTPGTYRLAVAVYDQSFLVANLTQDVLVTGDAAPVARITATNLTAEGAQPLYFSGLNSTDDYGVRDYRWIFSKLRFDFPGRFLDANQWSVANTVQDERLLIAGRNDWSSAWFLSSIVNVLRGGAIEGRVDTSAGTSYAMVGLRTLARDAGSYDSLVYAIYFNDGAITIYERGGNLGTVTNYNRGTSYDFRIETIVGAGARYYLRPSGATNSYIQIFESTNYTDAVFGFGAHVYSGTFGFDNIEVENACIDGITLSTPVFPGGTVSLEVRDHAGLSNLTFVSISTTIVTGAPPSVVINGPTNGPAGVGLSFNAYGSDDDYAIASYAWDFGDGTPLAFGPAVSHFYDSPGNFTVSVSVMDYAGQRTAASLLVTIGSSNAVVAVPWRIINGIELPHETYSGKEITLKAVARGVPAPFDYIWDFGDGTGSVTNTATNSVAAYGLEARHIYAAPDDTPFYATVRVRTADGTLLSDVYPILIRPKTLDVEMNVAIDEGLWWLHKQQSRYDVDLTHQGGDWTDQGYKVNATASSVQAFAINGHVLTDDGRQDPYVETVQRGINYLLTATVPYAIGRQPFGDPDGDHNGIGLSASGQPIYETGPLMDALVAAGRPEIRAPVGGAAVRGRALRDIMQDMVDMYSWGQSDGDAGGAWRYSWNDHPDNSASQWGAIGLIAAERYWDITVPSWIKERNMVWLNYSRAFGYTGSGDGEATTPSGLVQLAFQGVSTNHPLWRTAEANVAGRWRATMNGNNLYSHYAIAKAFRAMVPQPVQRISTGKNWFLDPEDGLARITVNTQRVDGSWQSAAWVGPPMSTAWSILILSGSLFQRGPVAVANVRPNPAGVGYPVVFDGRDSYHQHPSYRVTDWRWDFDESNGIDFDHPDAVGSVVTNFFQRPGTNTVTLQVRDNGTPQLNGSASAIVRIGISPFPPTADAAGPYLAAVREDVRLDGSGSFDVDAAQGDFIRSWDWETDFEQPLDFNDGVRGERAVMVGGFATAGERQIGLRVTDSTATVFPSSGSPNLSDDDFTRVIVYDRVVTNLLVRAKRDKCQLVWNKVGDYAVVMRSRIGPNQGFAEIGRTDSAYATFLDTNLEYNVEYFYRVFAYQNGRAAPLGISDSQQAISIPLDASDHPPFFIATPSRSATVGFLYEVTLQARDLENDAFVFNMLTNPPGMTLNRQSGVVRFTPAASQIGPHPVSFEVTNSGGRGVLSYELVVSPLTNTPPLAFANGPYTGTAGEPLAFSSIGTRDPDGDPLAYIWVFGDGTISTNPNPTHVYTAHGSYTVSLFVNDGRGGSASAFTNAQVIRVNRPPIARAGANQVALVTQTVQLNGSGSTDPDLDRLTYRWDFAARPAGSSANLQNPTSVRPSFVLDRPGSYVVRVVVNDGFTNSLPDAVTITTENSRPIANAGSDQRVPQGQTARLDGTASRDVDGNPLTYRWTFVRRPAGSAAQFNDATAAQPTFPMDVAGLYDVQLLVNDGFVDSLADTVRIATGNLPPVITSTPSTNAAPGVLWNYSIAATDVDGTNFTFSLVTAPPGMTVTTFGSSPSAGGEGRGEGELRWTPTVARLGSHSVTLRVTDGEGGTADQSFTLVVAQDSEAPTVAVSLIQGQLQPETGQWAAQLGSTAIFRVTGADNAGVPVLTLRVGSLNVSLDNIGVGSITATTAGLLPVVATATDAAGNVGATNSTILFHDPNAVSAIGITIHSPTNSELVTKPVAIVASITNASDLLSYRVDFARAADVNLDNISVEGPQFTVLTNVTLPPGTRRLTNAVLARFDPTILLNDDYLIRVVASDGPSLQYEGAVVSVSGNLKFGELRLEFTDLAVPLAGLPIAISRVYDSRDSRRSGDFGFGWSLGIQDAVIRESVPATASFRPGTRVNLTAPDGRRLGFTFAPTMVNASLFGALFEPKFVPDAGIYEKLEVPGGTFSFAGAGIIGDLSEALGPYNPSTYYLTTRDGTRYEYDQSFGLQTVTDLNTNRLVYTRDGIFHFSSGSTNADQSIPFIRDDQGRITQIIDPAGNTLNYTYDARGDLRSFADQTTNITQYHYSTARAHYLTNIIDPLGRQALRMEYDAAGRLVSITDALGNPIQQNFDVNSKVATYRDANGNTNIVRYDDNGNELMRVIPGVSTNFFAYDANNNLLASTNGRGFSTNFTYDAQGNQTSITDSLGNRTSIAYNAQNKPQSVTNALGQTLGLHYDSAGKLLVVVNNLGYQTTVTRDTAGRVASLTDAVGNTTQFDYSDGCACGKPGKIINPDGSFRLYEYNAQGLTNRMVNELGAETLFGYDDGGRLLWIRDPLSNYTRFFYSGPLLTNVVDALGRQTRYEYDALNRTNRIIDAQGGIVEFRYDANGNRTHVIDPVTNVTVFAYDTDNRLKHQVDPLGHTNFFAYDAAGNRIEAIDRNGRRRTFAYDAVNRMTNELWWEGTNIVRSIVFGFNGLGVQTLAMDPAARYDYDYDDLNRLAQVRQSAVPGQSDFTLDYTYNALGQIESVTDHWGVRVGSAYDTRNRLARRTWNGPGVDPARVDFAYDVAGNRTRTDRYADLAAANRIGHTTNAYNNAGIVTNITHLGPALEVLAKYDYTIDAAYQITRWSINNQLSTFNYDLTGQLTNALNTAQPSENFRYDANGNRINAQSSGNYVVGRNNQILSDGTNNYAYDLEGNMTFRSNKVTRVLTLYNFDHRNRLVGVLDRNPSGVVTQTVAFVYDAMNRRLGKTVSGNTTRFLYNQDDSWADIDGANGLIARYLHGARIDELLARQRATDGRGWHLTDRLGTVRDIANAAGTVVTHLDYKTFGQPLNAEDRISRFLFVGREYDLELGMYFYRTRFFDAQLGKFISEDSLRFESGDLNLYRYAANSPAIHTDPFGTSIVEEAAISRWIVIPTTAYIGVKIYIICQGVKGEKITIGGVIESAAFGGLGGITGATFTTLSIYLIGGNLGPIIVCSITDHL